MGKRKKGSKKYLVMLFLLALIVGGSCGLYYVDTFYGEGKINTILASLQERKKEPIKIVLLYLLVVLYFLPKEKNF